jgi:hypothetical protein
MSKEETGQPNGDTIDLPATRDTSVQEVEKLEAFAAVAQRRAVAMDTIIKHALKRTHPQDWVDMGNKPYLQESGAMRISNSFGISSGKPEGPLFEFDVDGHYTVMFKNTYTLNFAGMSNSMGSVGIRSSRDVFFTSRYEGDEKIELPASEVDRQTVIQSALANCNVNGIKDLLGLNNLSWDQVELFTGFKREQCGKAPFGGGGRGKGAESDVMLIPFREHKGKPITDPSVPVGDLEKYIDWFKKDLTDESKKNFWDRTKKQLAAYEAEVEKRKKAVPPVGAASKPGSEKTPPAVGPGPFDDDDVWAQVITKLDDNDTWATIKNQVKREEGIEDLRALKPNDRQPIFNKIVAAGKKKGVAISV